MGMSWSDYLGIGLQGAGTVASTATVNPLFGGLGTALSSGLSLLDKNKQVKMPGQTPEQEKSLFYSSELARRSMAQTGISANTAGRVAQAGRESSLADIAEANTFGRMLSPLDRMMLTRKLTERAETNQSKLMENLLAYAEGKDTQNLSTAGQLSQNMFNQATTLERDRTEKFKAELNERKSQFEQYKNSMVNLSEAMSGSIFDFKNKDKKPETGTQSASSSLLGDKTLQPPSSLPASLDFGTAPELKASEVTGGIENLNPAERLDLEQKRLYENDPASQLWDVMKSFGL